MTNQERIDQMNRRSQERENRKSEKSDGFPKWASVYMKYKPGDNVLRPVGNFWEVHSHKISPNDYGSIGVAPQQFFRGKDFLPFDWFCGNWDVASMSSPKEKTCKLCRLNFRAYKMSKKKGLSQEEKKMYDGIKTATALDIKYRWNVIDRAEPHYLRVHDGTDISVPGFKIASFTKNLFGDVQGLFEQTKLDIADKESGIDVIVKRATQVTNNKEKTVYKAVPFMEDLSVKITPLTEEELSWPEWDIVTLSKNGCDFEKIESVMHPHFLELLNMSDEDFNDLLEAEAEEEYAKPATDKKETRPDKPVTEDTKKKNVSMTQETEPVPTSNWDSEDSLPF